ncbi:hypothetical protein CHARACLAT_016529 [Characodon lateralis]|uniref:Uncharacterized protein n=1 Tax=Characodon lateralis TaxID=208331 RepID=A0ABU7F3J3_9TELE|nr:hypothetical protein [Characodon lateralis]
MSLQYFHKMFFPQDGIYVVKCTLHLDWCSQACNEKKNKTFLPNVMGKHFSVIRPQDMSPKIKVFVHLPARIFIRNLALILRLIGCYFVSKQILLWDTELAYNWLRSSMWPRLQKSGN